MLPTAPFVKRKAIVPPDQVQRFGPTQTLHMIHYDTPLFGTGQILQPEEHLFMDQNRCRSESLCSLKLAGQFTNWKQFVVYGVGMQCFFTQLAPVQGNEATAEECYDLFVYYSRVQMQYQDSLKQILWVDQIPAGGGVYGSSNTAGAFHLTNGEPIANAFFKLKEPLVITPQKTFSLNLKWASTPTNVTPAVVTQDEPLTRFNNAIRTQKLVRIYLHGIEGRDISNG